MQSNYFIVVFSLFTLFTAPAQATDPDIETRVSVVRGELHTEVYLAEVSPAQGTVLIRSPYIALDSYEGKVRLWSDLGFHVVLQSIAGTGRSTGNFKYLSTDEIGDAQHTLQWLAQQSFSNDRVLLYGESYDGFLALAAALTGHPSVQAVVAASAPTDPFKDSFSAGGMVDHELLRYYVDVSSSRRMSKRRFQQRVEGFYRRGTPLEHYDDSFRNGGFVDWQEFIAEASQLSFSQRGISDRLHEISVPVLLMAGEIQDQDATDAIHAYQLRRDRFTIPQIRCATKLAVGPWVHGNQISLSQKVAQEYVAAVFSDTLDCEFQHQIEYIHDDQSTRSPSRVGRTLSPEIFEKSSMSLGMSDVEYGVLYDTEAVDPLGQIPLPQICQPWDHISPGLDRPFVRIPIDRNMRLTGSIHAEIHVKTPSQDFIGMSMEILVGKAGGGWRSLDENYNIHRTRKRVKGHADEPVSVTFQSPYLSLDLEKGDELVLSFQRSHDAINHCSNEEILWQLDENHSLEVSFHHDSLAGE